MIIHLTVLFTGFITFSSQQSDTIDSVCDVSGSRCDANQACINEKCQCNPKHDLFWAGKFGCRVCPPGYIRQPTRCYKYFPTSKNHSEARADCRSKDADLFSWRDNSDENELLQAATKWNFTFNPLTHQFYTWSGGMVHHGQGTKEEYKITWFDPKGPTIRHPVSNDQLSERFCNKMTKTNYEGEPEPTRIRKNGENEDCATIVFVPQHNTRGLICMADDYCSRRMGYICEITETTLAGHYEPLPGKVQTTKRPIEGQLDTTGGRETNSDNESKEPLALTDSEKSNTMMFAIGAIVILVMIGAVAFIFIRKRKQNNLNVNVTPRVSTASTIMSGAENYENA